MQEIIFQIRSIIQKRTGCKLSRTDVQATLRYKRKLKSSKSWKSLYVYNESIYDSFEGGYSRDVENNILNNCRIRCIHIDKLRALFKQLYQDKEEDRQITTWIGNQEVYIN